MHSVRIEPMKLFLVGTRITYQATGDAGINVIIHQYPNDPNIPDRMSRPGAHPCVALESRGSHAELFFLLLLDILIKEAHRQPLT